MRSYSSKIKNTNDRSSTMVRPQSTVQSIAAGIDLASSVSNVNSGRSLDLPEALRERVQSQFGFSPDSLRISESPHVSAMGLDAAAQGDTITFAPGAFDPYTESGRELIGHELNHIVQQAHGLDSNVKGVNIHYNPVSESASDTAGHLFASGGPVTSAAAPLTPVSAVSAPIQGRRRRGGMGQGPGIFESLKETGVGFVNKIGDAWERLTKSQESKDTDELKIVRDRITKKKPSEYKNFEDNEFIGSDVGMLLKNLQGIEQVQNEFGGFDIQDIKLEKDERDFAGASYSTGFDSKNLGFGNRIFFNSSVWDKKNNKLRSGVGKRLKNGLYGQNTAGQEYMGVHEAGHAVNAEIIDRLFGITKHSDRGKVGRDKNDINSDPSFYKDYINHQTSTNILNEAITRLYLSDKKFRKGIQKQAGVIEGDKEDVIAKKVGDLLKANKSLTEKDKDDKGVTDIKKSLYNLGYTSKYGMTNPAEFFAESFSDHYSTKDKNDAISKKKKSFFRRREKPVEENPLSKMIVQISKELLDKGNDTDLKYFQKKYGYK